MPRSNPTGTEMVEIVGGGAGVLSALFGAQRLGGAFFIGSGIYSLTKGRPRYIGGLYSALGLGLFFLPEIRTALASAPAKKQLSESSKPPVYRVALREGTFDEDIGGGWVLLDARAKRVRAFDTDKDIHVGNVVSLLLQSGGVTSKTPIKVFNVKVLGISGDDFTGQWVSGTPAGGPQMIDFRGAHIFDFH